MTLSFVRVVRWSLAFTVCVASRGAAQVVTPKTVPVLQHGQFDILPSARSGMADVRIALDDTLLDPFVNPAKAMRLTGSHFLTLPFVHSISGERGGGRSLPFGAIAQRGAWAATGVVAWQQLDRAGPTWNLTTAERTAVNEYVAGSIARRLSPHTSLGLSAQLAGLDAIDGVDLLYAGSSRIDQRGSLADFRLGVLRESPANTTFEAVLVHARTGMTHDVDFPTFRFDSVRRIWSEFRNTEHNEDRTHIWGLHTEYTRPIGREGWRLGWLGTVNRLSHPKIPNYVIMNIPRDPGTTHSANAGVGLARLSGGSTFGLDVVYEPMLAETWADVARDTVLNGRPFRAGDKTIENSFRFSNLRFRVGGGRDFTRGGTTFGFQTGVGMYAINYRLRQYNNIDRSRRTQREDWVEWTPSLSLRMRSRDLDIQYAFSQTCGAGGCTDQPDFRVFAEPARVTLSSAGIIAAPSAPLVWNSGRLRTHKLQFSLPIR